MFQSLAKSHQNEVGETLVKVCLYAFFFTSNKSILIRTFFGCFPSTVVFELFVTDFMAKSTFIAIFYCVL